MPFSHWLITFIFLSKSIVFLFLLKLSLKHSVFSLGRHVSGVRWSSESHFYKVHRNTSRAGAIRCIECWLKCWTECLSQMSLTVSVANVSAVWCGECLIWYIWHKHLLPLAITQYLVIHRTDIQMNCVGMHQNIECFPLNVWRIPLTRVKGLGILVHALHYFIIAWTNSMVSHCILHVWLSYAFSLSTVPMWRLSFSALCFTLCPKDKMGSMVECPGLIPRLALS